MPVEGAATALIIPALNEEAVIGAMLDEVDRSMVDAVVVADNGSGDRTAEIAASRGAAVVREEERGYGAACLKAIEALPEWAGVVVFMQADLSEDPGEIAGLVKPIARGEADLVIGSRVLGRAEPGALLPHQKFGNWLACGLIRAGWGFRYTDLGPFRAIRAGSLKELGMQDRNYGWTVEMQIRALKRGLRVREMPVAYRLRRAGTNKVSGNVRASLRAGWVIISTVAKMWWRDRKGP